MLNKLEEILKESNEKGQIIPIKSVGVQGDCRSYRNLGLLYGNGTDLEWDKVTTLAKKITDKINEIHSKITENKEEIRVAYNGSKNYAPGYYWDDGKNIVFCNPKKQKH